MNICPFILTCHVQHCSNQDIVMGKFVKSSLKETLKIREQERYKRIINDPIITQGSKSSERRSVKKKKKC